MSKCHHEDHPATTGDRIDHLLTRVERQDKRIEELTERIDKLEQRLQSHTHSQGAV